MKKITRKKGLLILLFFTLASVIAIYFSSLNHGQLFLGADKDFHIARIVTLSELLKQHIIYSPINPFMINGYGYASSLFYPDFLIYIPAIIHTIGVSLAKSYIIFQFLLNFLTLVSAFYAYLWLKNNIRGAVIFASLYTFSMYRMVDLLLRAAIGEVQSFIFLPWVLVGFYEIMFGKNKNFWILSVSMSCMVMSNINATITTALMLIVLIVFNIRVFIKDGRWLIFIKAALLAFGMSFFYLSSMLEQFVNEQFYVSGNHVLSVKNSMISFGQFITESFNNHAHAVGIGIVLILIWIVLLINIQRLSTFEKKLFLVATILILMTTTMMPSAFYDKTPLKVIQFTYRIYEPITLLLSYCGAALFEKIKNKGVVSLIVLMPLAVVVKTSLDYSPQMYATYLEVNTYQWTRNTNSVGGFSEFMPKRLDRFKYFTKERKIVAKNSKLSHVTIHDNQIYFKYSSNKQSEIILPVTFYKGYRIESKGDGRASQPYIAKNGLSAIKVQGTGYVTFKYAWTNIQKCALLINCAVIFGLIYRFWLKKKTV